MLLAPGVGVDVDGVAVLGEAIDEGYDTRGAGKDGTPLLECEVGGDHRRALLVTTADDVIEEVGGAIVARQIPEFVEDQDVGSGIATETALEGGQRLLAQQVGEGGGEGRKADGETMLEGGEAEAAGERGLADPRWATQEHVVAVVGEVEGEEVLDENTVDVARVRPVESVDGLGGSEGGELGAAQEIALLADTALEGDKLLEGLLRPETALGGMGEERREGVVGEAQAECAKGVEEVIVWHRIAPGREG